VTQLSPAPHYLSMANLFINPTLEAIGEISGDESFRGFFTASELNQTLQNNPSINLCTGMEYRSAGNIDLRSRTETELEEPLANSTLLGPVYEC